MTKLDTRKNPCFLLLVGIAFGFLMLNVSYVEGSSFVVNNGSPISDGDVEDGICDTGNQDDGYNDKCTFQAAIESAQWNLGNGDLMLEISFSGPMTVTTVPDFSIGGGDYDSIILDGGSGSPVKFVDIDFTNRWHLHDQGVLDNLYVNNIWFHSDDPENANISVANFGGGAITFIFHQASPTRCVIQNSYFTGWANGILLGGFGQPISGCKIINNSFGIDPNDKVATNYLMGIQAIGNNNEIDSNIIVNPWQAELTVGLQVSGDHNKIKNNDIGIAPKANGEVWNSIGVSIAGNKNEIYNNTISNSKIVGEIFDGKELVGNGLNIVGHENEVWGNFIGTDRSGNPLGNENHGIYIWGNKNIIGMTKNFDESSMIREGWFRMWDYRNTISGNWGNGIYLDARSDENKIDGNVIGLDDQAEKAIPNKNGIFVQGMLNKIGVGAIGVSSNIISGNDENGILIYNAQFTYVDNNAIGTTMPGYTDLGKTVIERNLGNGKNGIEISGSMQDNYIGTKGKNVIGSNTENGIKINKDSEKTTIEANDIGMYEDFKLQTFFLGNKQNGILIEGNNNLVENKNRIANHTKAIVITGRDNYLEDNEVFKNGDGFVVHGTNNGIIKNKILSNTFTGIKIPGTHNIIQENTIYFNRDGIVIGGDYNEVTNSNLIGGCEEDEGPNFRDGIQINGNNNVVYDNQINKNQRHGIYIAGVGAVHNKIEANGISWNSGSGIVLDGATDTMIIHNNLELPVFCQFAPLAGNGRYGIEIIGGSTDNVILDNIIRKDRLDGILVKDPDTLRNTITQNSISKHLLKGIKNLDGGNKELSPPVAFDIGPTTPGQGVKITVTGSTCPNCLVEIFTDARDEGLVYEGNTRADFKGIFEFTKILEGDENHLTCTTIDNDLNTSEFGCLFDIPISPFHLTKSDEDVNAEDLVKGDIIKYTIELINSSDKPTQNILDKNELEDKIPENSKYVAESITVDGISNNDDIKDGTGYDGTGNKIIWNGIVEPHSTLTITFKVRVNSDLADNSVISNQAFFYQGITEIKSDDPDTPAFADPTLSILNEIIETPEPFIPDWVRKNAAGWGDGALTDKDFALGIKYMIEKGIIKVKPPIPSEKTETEFPEWIRENAKWWGTGRMPDADFASGIEYMIEVGIIQAQFG